MFTGLVRAVGVVKDISNNDGVRKFFVEGGIRPSDLTLGASVCHGGVCLTVVGLDTSSELPCWQVEAVPETLNLTTLGDWAVGENINLEPSLRLGDELGGHLVFGHCDGIGIIENIATESGSFRVTIRPPKDLEPLIAYKGSICVDGTSLTISGVQGDGAFELAIIPHTWDVTTIGKRKIGDKVNLEVDMLARYVARQTEFRTK